VLMLHIRPGIYGQTSYCKQNGRIFRRFMDLDYAQEKIVQLPPQPRSPCGKSKRAIRSRLPKDRNPEVSFSEG
jgi:hypothetical protein